jgi:hypothetical protein
MVLTPLEGWAHPGLKEENRMKFLGLKLPLNSVHQSTTLNYFIGLSRCTVGEVFEFLAHKRLSDC